MAHLLAAFSHATFGEPATKAQSIFGVAQQTILFAQAHAVLVDEAAWLDIRHDLYPRTMSKQVENFHPARSWS